MTRELQIEAPNGARVARCSRCRQPFYSREAGTRCQVCTPTASAAALRECPLCGYQWEGPGAGAARDACPMLGCAGRVPP